MEESISLQQKDTGQIDFFIAGTSESVTKLLKDLGQRMARIENFNQRHKETVDFVSLIDTIFTIRAVFGVYVATREEIDRDPRFKKIHAYFQQTDAFTHDLFRPAMNEGNRLSPESSVFKDARELASLGAMRELLRFFAKKEERNDQTTARIRSALSQIGEEQVRALVLGEAIPSKGVDLTSLQMDGEEFSLFVHLVFRGPNSGWKTAILERTACQEDIDLSTRGLQLAIEKSNVGTFEWMIKKKKEEGKQKAERSNGSSDSTPKGIALATSEVIKDIQEFRLLLDADMRPTADVDRTLESLSLDEKKYWILVRKKMEAMQRARERVTHSRFEFRHDLSRQ